MRILFVDENKTSNFMTTDKKKHRYSIIFTCIYIYISIHVKLYGPSCEIIHFIYILINEYAEMVMLMKQGLVLLSLSSYLFLLKPTGCGGEVTACGPHSGVEVGLFYLSIYMTALGNGGYQPNIATFGADQFDEKNPKDSHSKISFFSYFYLAHNLGSPFSNTFLSYIENEGTWVFGFRLCQRSLLLPCF